MNMIIGGQRVAASDGQTLNVLNPATGACIDTVPKASAQDVEIAMDWAKRGQVAWASVPLYQRANVLTRFVQAVESEHTALSELLSRETGKPIREARAEIGNIRIAFNAFVERAKHLYDMSIPSGTEPGQEQTMQVTVREPVGVVACIIPFNFPCDLFDQKVAPALIMGNAAVVLPSSKNPLTVLRLTELLAESGVPRGAIQCLTGDGAIVGPLVVAHEAVTFVSFTGSTEVGKDVAKRAAGHLAHVALELGGNDAFLVFEDADLDLAVEAVISGRLYNTGQICCASKRFIVHESVKVPFIKRLVDRLEQLTVGDPMDDSTDVGCLITEEAAIAVAAQVQAVVEAGGRLVCGGLRKGAFYMPTVIDSVSPESAVARDMEIFGPVIPIISFKTEEEALAIANTSVYGLSSCVFTRDMSRAFRVAHGFQAGVAVINGSSFFRSFEMPFGGYKHSGLGTEGVSSTLEEMSLTKTLVLKDVLK